MKLPYTRLPFHVDGGVRPEAQSVMKRYRASYRYTFMLVMRVVEVERRPGERDVDTEAAYVLNRRVQGESKRREWLASAATFIQCCSGSGIREPSILSLSLVLYAKGRT